MLDIEFPFGQEKVRILNHRTEKLGLIHHKADIRTSRGISKVFLKHEVIDLVSRALGHCPLEVGIYGSRVVLEKGNNHYELHWNTGSGRK
jgi:hypothetical protein